MTAVRLFGAGSSRVCRQHGQETDLRCFRGIAGLLSYCSSVRVLPSYLRREHHRRWRGAEQHVYFLAISAAKVRKCGVITSYYCCIVGGLQRAAGVPFFSVWNRAVSCRRPPFRTVSSPGSAPSPCAPVGASDSPTLSERVASGNSTSESQRAFSSGVSRAHAPRATQVVFGVISLGACSLTANPPETFSALTELSSWGLLRARDLSQELVFRRKKLSVQASRSHMMHININTGTNSRLTSFKYIYKYDR